VAITLAEDPGRFLSTVQIGITLTGVFAGAFSGATLAHAVALPLEKAGLEAGLAETLGFTLVVILITYFSLILGELVPKQIALRYADETASRVAPAMRALAKVGSPLVTLIDRSADLVLRLLGAQKPPPQRVTDEEIRALIAEAESTGVVGSAEKDMIGAVMRLGDRRVGALMTPRPEVEWIDLDGGEAEIRQTLMATKHSRLPVARGSVDHIEGVVSIRDVLEMVLAGKPFDLTPLLRPPPVFHENADAPFVVETLRNTDHHMGLVVDEYGSAQGVITRADVLEAIIGEMKEAGVDADPSAVQRVDGSWLLDGSMPMDEMAERIGFPLPAARDYHTLAGFILTQLQEMPKAGDRFAAEGWSFEVIDMDGRRVDKVLAQRSPERRRRG
jgi:putative hemolysin